MSSTTILKPTFSVLDDVPANVFYEYTVTMSATGIDDISEDVTVTILEKPDIKGCSDDVNITMSVDEGSGAVPLLICMTRTGAPEGSVYTSTWSTRDGTPSSALSLLNTANPQPLFLVPADVPRDTTYKYLLTVSADNADDLTERYNVTVRDTDSTAPSLTCTDSEVYEATADFTLDCSVANEPSDATYAWTARGSTSNTDDLSSTSVLTPTFSVPDDIPGVHVDEYKKTYEYTVTMSAADISDITADVTVTVLEKPNIRCGNQTQVVTVFARDEGAPDFQLNTCLHGWTRAPGANPVYTFAWTARGSTANTDLLSATNIESPTFAVPDTVESTETYTYTLTVSAANADDMSVQVVVEVRDTDTPTPVLACNDSEVYEGTADIMLGCSVTDEPSGATYAWTARGSTSDTDDLSNTSVLTPTFSVPGDIDEPGGSDKAYEYTVTLSAGGADVASTDITVTVLEKPDIAVTCGGNPYNVYEGDNNITLDCVASGTPSGSSYTYAWTPRGSTSNTDLLSNTAIASPDFLVPDEVDANETYEYTLTVSANNADDGTAEVTVRVLDKGTLNVVCTNTPIEVYEGSDDFELDCLASGAPAGSDYTYEWTPRGSTTNTALLSATDVRSPFFYVPDEVSADETYEYTLTVSAANADPATAEVAVTVRNKEPLSLVCTDPDPVYEGSADFALDCTASGAPDGPYYVYEWTARGSTSGTALLSAIDVSSPLFHVPDVVSSDETYEYTLTVSADNALDATAEVTVTVLNKRLLSLACTDPGPVYEGSADFALDCVASGAPSGSSYTYEWTPRGNTANTDLFIATKDSSTQFYNTNQDNN
ncbi:MAG: hypothetical protein F4118_02435 [Acidimicrobiaceae bacterium]|nr:hypothetical protein [Acidimicrobiaceae bacterium]